MTISVGSFIRFGWETFKRRPWFLIGAIIVLFLAQMAVSFVVGIIDGIGIAADSQNATNVLVFVVNLVGQAIVTMGFLAFFLKAHDDVDGVRLTHLWHPQNFWKFLGLVVLLYVILLIGFVLFIIPGIVAMLMFYFAPYLVIDRGLNPIEALKESARITKGHRWRILALVGALGLVAFLGILALFVGILVAIPVTYLANMHAYRTLSAAAEAEVTPPALSGGEKVLAGLFLLIPALAIASAIALSALSAARDQGAVALNTVNLKQIQLALETHYDTNQAFPAVLGDIQGADLSSIDFADYTYSPGADGQTYELCTSLPVAEGQSQCVTESN